MKLFDIEETISLEHVRDLLQNNKQLLEELDSSQILGQDTLFEGAFDKETVFVKSFLNWLHIETSAFTLIQRICKDFHKGVEVLEHYGDYFRLRLEKEDGLSIGRLFGVMEDCKTEGNIIIEYSVN